MPPLLVVVTGPPGAGKSSVARELAGALGLPLVAKDDFKETLFATLEAADVEQSRRLGVVAWDLLFHVVGELLAAGDDVVAEGNFSSAGRLRALPQARVVQVHLSAPPELLLERYLTRPRHPGHQTEAYAAEIEARIRDGDWDPLDLDAPLLRLDTSAPVDVGALVETIRTQST